MTNTERKLDEAYYFLNQLNPDDPYFDYILSAYLNAARSTSWIMRYEFLKINGWEEWFKNTDISEEQKVLLKKINDMRILSTKQSGIKTEFYFLDCIIPDEEYFPSIKEILDQPDGTEYKITIKVLDESIKEEDLNDDSYIIKGKIKGKVKKTKDTSEFSREAIQKLCNDYYVFLKKQVRNCIEKFNN
jgi:hypothetical protein